MSKLLTELMKKEAIQDLLPSDDFETADRAKFDQIWNDDLEEGEAPSPYKEGKSARDRYYRNRKSAIDKLQKLFGDNFNEKLFTVTDVIPVMYIGWEMDEKAFLVIYKDHPYVLGTSHGTLYSMTPADLRNKLDEYRESLGATQNAIHFLEHP